MILVREVYELGGLEPFRGTWEGLLAQTEQAQFFQTMDWLEVYWRHYGARQRLRVLIVEEDGKPLGILPLVVRKEPTKAGELRFLTYPLDDWGSFYGPIGRDPALILQHGLAHVRSTRKDWDVLELRWVDSDGADANQSEQAMAGGGFSPLPTRRGETAIIDLRGTWQDYLASRTSKWRNNFRRWHKRLAERGEVTYLRYRPRGAALGESDPRFDLYDACEELARRSWQGSSTTGTTLSHESVSPFLRDMHAAAARAGGLDLNLLYLNGKPMAYAYNYVYRGYVFGLRIGYDAEIGSDGVGNLTYTYAIEDSFARGDHTYDAGPGSLDCKRQLWTRLQPIYRYSYYRPAAWRAQLVRLKRWADGWLSPAEAQDGDATAVKAGAPSAIQ